MRQIAATRRCDKFEFVRQIAATMIFTCHTRRFVAATCRGDVSQRFVASCASAFLKTDELTYHVPSCCCPNKYAKFLGKIVFFSFPSLRAGSLFLDGAAATELLAGSRHPNKRGCPQAMPFPKLRVCQRTTTTRHMVSYFQTFVMSRDTHIETFSLSDQ